MRGKWIRGILLAVLLTGAGGCSTIDLVTGRRTRNMYTMDEDISLGRSVMQQSTEEMRKAGVPINQDTRQLEKIRTIAHKIVAVSHMPTMPVDVVLFQTGIVNAAAAPGGEIMVFSGLYDGRDALVHGDDELAAVLAHEVAHVTCRHTTEAMTRQAPVNILLMAGAIYAGVKEDSDVGLAVGAAFLLYNGLWVPKYSRHDEAEADAVGLTYMAKAGYDPRAAIRIWDRAAAKNTTPNWLNFLSDHPADSNRKKALTKLLPQAMEEYAKVHGGYPPDYVPPPDKR